MGISRGTGGSNLVPSSGESANSRSRSGGRWLVLGRKALRSDSRRQGAGQPVFAELASREFVRCAWRVGLTDTAPFGELPGPVLDVEASCDANQVMYLPFTSGTTGQPSTVPRRRERAALDRGADRPALHPVDRRRKAERPLHRPR